MHTSLSTDRLPLYTDWEIIGSYSSKIPVDPYETDMPRHSHCKMLK